MKYNNISLPYPVLGINDDIYPLLESDCVQIESPQKTTAGYTFKIHLKQSNQEIERLIDNGKAEYACEVTCKDTFLRKCFRSESGDFEISLLRTEVNGRINFDCYVAVKCDLPQYCNSEFNDDYRGFKFDLTEGDLLVVFPNAYYNTNVKYDKLYAAGSFMQIVEAEEGADRTWFNLDEERIQIELPAQLFEQYLRIGNAFPEVIHSSLVHNALVYALCHLEEYIDKGKLWADSIVQRLQSPEYKDFEMESLSTDMNMVYKLADTLLQDPYKRLLDSLERLGNNLKDDMEV
jgi:hypothetical protein